MRHAWVCAETQQTLGANTGGRFFLSAAGCSTCLPVRWSICLTEFLSMRPCLSLPGAQHARAWKSE